MAKMETLFAKIWLRPHVPALGGATLVHYFEEEWPRLYLAPRRDGEALYVSPPILIKAVMNPGKPRRRGPVSVLHEKGALTISIQGVESKITITLAEARLIKRLSTYLHDARSQAEKHKHYVEHPPKKSSQRKWRHGFKKHKTQEDKGEA